MSGRECGPRSAVHVRVRLAPEHLRSTSGTALQRVVMMQAQRTGGWGGVAVGGCSRGVQLGQCVRWHTCLWMDACTCWGQALAALLRVRLAGAAAVAGNEQELQAHNTQVGGARRWLQCGRGRCAEEPAGTPASTCSSHARAIARTSGASFACTHTAAGVPSHLLLSADCCSNALRGAPARKLRRRVHQTANATSRATTGLRGAKPRCVGCCSRWPGRGQNFVCVVHDDPAPCPRRAHLGARWPLLAWAMGRGAMRGSWNRVWGRALKFLRAGSIPSCLTRRPMLLGHALLAGRVQPRWAGHAHGLRHGRLRTTLAPLPHTPRRPLPRSTSRRTAGQHGLHGYALPLHPGLLLRLTDVYR